MFEYSYSEATVDLAAEWADKWFQLSELLIGSLCCEDDVLPSSAQIRQLKYRHLRDWFISHKSEIDSLWQDFWREKDWTLLLNEDLDIRESLKDIDNALRNGCTSAFIDEFSSSFYDPENLDVVISDLCKQYEIDKRNQIDDGVRKAIKEMSMISYFVTVFVLSIEGKM